MLAGGPRFPSSSAAPTPGAVRLARSDQWTPGAHAWNRGQVLYTSQRTARPRGGALFPIQASCRVLRPRLDTRWHRVYPIASRRPFRARRLFQHASRAIGHRDGAASSSASSWAPSVAPALFPNVPPASVGRGEAFDPDTRKRRARRPLSRQCSLKLTVRARCESPAPPGPAPLFPILPSAAVGRGGRRSPDTRKRRASPPDTEQSRLTVKLLRGASEAGTAPFSASRQPTGRGEAFDSYRSTNGAAPGTPFAHSTGHDPPSTRLARRLPLVLSARGEGRRGTSR